jgi:hypothetical protein
MYLLFDNVHYNWSDGLFSGTANDSDGQVEKRSRSCGSRGQTFWYVLIRLGYAFYFSGLGWHGIIA